MAVYTHNTTVLRAQTSNNNGDDISVRVETNSQTTVLLSIENQDSERPMSVVLTKRELRDLAHTVIKAFSDQ